MNAPALLAALALAAAPAAKPRLAVLDFTVTGADPKVAATFAQLLAAELSALGRYEVLSRNDTAALVNLTRENELLGCTDGGCLAQIGGMLDARYVVAGALGKAGSLLVASVQIIDSARARVLNRAALRAGSQEELVAGAGRLARDLCAEPATLQLYNQTAGGTVFLDDKLLGTMPLPPQPMAATGRHRLRAESPDSVPWESEVDVEPGRTTRVKVELERIDELESKSRTRKWVGGALAVAGVGMGVGSAFSFRSGFALKDEYDKLDPLDSTQAQLDDLADRAKIRYGLGWGLAAGGTLCVAGALWMLLSDPYADALKKGAAIDLAPAVMPGRGGAAIGVTATGGF